MGVRHPLALFAGAAIQLAKAPAQWQCGVFKPRRQFERFAKVFDGFIECESRWVGGNFKKNATRLTEIDGMEISPIEHGCDVQWHFRKHFAPLKLCAVIRRPECDVMYGSSTHVSVDKLRLNEDVDAVP